MRDLRIDMDMHTQFEGSFKERTVEIGAVGMPIGVPIFLSHFGEEVCFAEDFTVAVRTKDESLGIYAVFFKFGGYAPSF